MINACLFSFYIDIIRERKLSIYEKQKSYLVFWYDKNLPSLA